VAPIEPDLDPWEDTQEGRGPEMDNPYLDAVDNPLGASSELLGVPNWSRGIRRGPPSARAGVTRAILFVLLATILVGVVYSALRILT